MRAAGLEEDTLIVFFSDNGGPTMRGTTINGSRNDPLRGSKRTTLEGGIRVPFVVSWKGTLPAGAVYDQPVIQLDVLPTVLAAAGVDVESGMEARRRQPAARTSRATSQARRTTRSTGGWASRRPFAGETGSSSATTERSMKRMAQSDAQTEAKVTKPRLYNLARDLGEKRRSGHCASGKGRRAAIAVERLGCPTERAALAAWPPGRCRVSQRSR